MGAVAQPVQGGPAVGGAGEFGDQHVDRVGALAGERGVGGAALVQVGGADQQGGLVHGLEQELQLPRVVGGPALRVVLIGAERLDQAEAEPQRRIDGLGGGVPGAEPAAQFGEFLGRGAVEPAVGGGEGVQPALGDGRPRPGAAVDREGGRGVRQCGAGLGVHQCAQGRAQQRVPVVGAVRPLPQQDGRAASGQGGGLAAPGRGEVGPPPGLRAAVGGGHGQRLDPAAADRPPGEVVHSGEPAQRGAVDHLDPSGAGQIAAGDGPDRVEDLTEQLGGGPGPEEQGRHPPGREHGAAARRRDRKVGRGRGDGADGGQQQGGPALGGLSGEPAEARSDAAEHGGQLAGRAGVGVGARGGPVGLRFGGAGVGAGVLGPERQVPVRPPERVQDEHRGPFRAGWDRPSQPIREVRQGGSAEPFGGTRNAMVES